MKVINHWIVRNQNVLCSLYECETGKFYLASHGAFGIGHYMLTAILPHEASELIQKTVW